MGGFASVNLHKFITYISLAFADDKVVRCVVREACYLNMTFIISMKLARPPCQYYHLCPYDSLFLLYWYYLRFSSAPFSLHFDSDASEMPRERQIFVRLSFEIVSASAPFSGFLARSLLRLQMYVSKIVGTVVAIYWT